MKTAIATTILTMGIGICSTALAAEVSPTTQPTTDATVATAAPTTQPAEDVASLIVKLGDDNYRTRLEAADKLKKIGKPAIPALAEASKSNNLEVQVRAGDLINEIEHPAVPPEKVPQPSGENGSHSVSITRNNRTMVVVSRDPGRTTRVEEDADGIRMTVTGQIDGKEVTREYKAPSQEALKKGNPEAFALYQETTGLMHGGGQFGAIQLGGMQIQNAGVHIQMNRVQVNVGGAAGPRPMIIGPATQPAPNGGPGEIRVESKIEINGLEIPAPDKAPKENADPKK